MDDLGRVRLEKRRLGDGAGDLILDFKYLKACQVEQGLASYIVLKDRIGPNGTKHGATGVL